MGGRYEIEARQCTSTAEETKGMFIDILPELPKDEGVAKVSFYLIPRRQYKALDIHTTLEELKEFLCDIGDLCLQSRRLRTKTDKQLEAVFKPLCGRYTYKSLPGPHRCKGKTHLYR